MRIGFDIDGVLANFIPPYQKLFVTLTGRDTFEPGDDTDPPSWNWPTDKRGYTKEETSRVWEAIKVDPSFWVGLPAIAENVRSLKAALNQWRGKHEVYFITSRMGDHPKLQTERWLNNELGYGHMHDHTVLIVAHRVKGLVAKALQLDAYIDDNLDNVIDCLKDSPKTRTYLLNRNYNQGDASYTALTTGTDGATTLTATRVNSLSEFVVAEGLVDYRVNGGVQSKVAETM